jgi:hypothetical protein
LQGYAEIQGFELQNCLQKYSTAAEELIVIKGVKRASVSIFEIASFYTPSSLYVPPPHLLCICIVTYATQDLSNYILQNYSTCTKSENCNKHKVIILIKE